jgi:hypothetical protein
MKRIVFLFLFALVIANGNAQTNEGKWRVAFPITDYIVQSSDSISIVQLQMPDGWALPEKQLGILKAIYRDKIDTTMYGWGRCQLIKGDYYYIGLHTNKEVSKPKAGDLFYTMLKKNDACHGIIPELAAHAIVLQDVYEKELYDRWKIMTAWSVAEDDSLLQAIVSDIQFTGKAMQDQSPGMNVKIAAGFYKDKMLFDIMKAVTVKESRQFFNYVLSRPYIYAGNHWKTSEIFATWVNAGAPGT